MSDQPTNDMGDPKPTSAFGDDFDGSRNTWLHHDEVELLHLVELIREGDRVRVNERSRPITVQDIQDGEGQRVIILTGNGTRYSIVLERDDGQPSHAVLRTQSFQELITHLKVTNRNPFNIRQYDLLLGEELDSTAQSHYRDAHAPRTRVERTEWTVEGDELAAVKWATWGFVQHYRDGAAMGGGPDALGYYQDALALWESIRGERDSQPFAGAEMGLIGAYLDYAVEDPDIRDRLPEAAVDAADALRRRDEVQDISHLGHPEDYPADADVSAGVIIAPGVIRVQHCTECDERRSGEDVGTAGNGGKFCQVCGHNTDTKDVQVGQPPERADGGEPVVMTDGGENPPSGSYRAVLSALHEGTKITFNNSGGANAQGTDELTVTVAGRSPYFEGPNYGYEVRERDGELVLYYGDKDSAYAPEKRYDIIETIEVVGEAPRSLHTDSAREDARTDGGEDPSSAALGRWGGEVREFTTENYSRSFYTPPEDIQGGPLDYYLMSYDPRHFVPGPEYREDVETVWGPDEDPGERPDTRSLCRTLKVYVAHAEGLDHYLEMLADIFSNHEWDGPRELDDHIREAHPRTAFSQIPGSPTTVLGTSCGNCRQIYRSRWTVDEVHASLNALWALEQAEPQADGGSDEPNLLGGQVSEGDRLELEINLLPGSEDSGFPEHLTGEVIRSDHEHDAHTGGSGELDIRSGGDVYAMEYSPFGMWVSVHRTKFGRVTGLAYAPEVETDGGEAEKLTEAMTSVMSGVQFSADADPDEEYTTEINLFVNSRIKDGEPGVSVSGTAILGSEAIREIEQVALGVVDLRKAPRPTGRLGKSVTIGTVTYTGEGEVLDVDVDDEYLKPSARGDGDDIPEDPPDHLDHVAVVYRSRRSDSDITKTGTVRQVTPEEDRLTAVVREDGENGRDKVLLVVFDEDGGDVFSQTRRQTTHLGPLTRLAVEGDHVDLCPKCGRPYESVRGLGDRHSADWSYTHESEIQGVGGFGFRMIQDSCIWTDPDAEDGDGDE